jgi:hypothetical protein
VGMVCATSSVYRIIINEQGLYDVCVVWVWNVGTAYTAWRVCEGVCAVCRVVCVLYSVYRGRLQHPSRACACGVNM